MQGNSSVATKEGENTVSVGVTQFGTIGASETGKDARRRERRTRDVVLAALVVPSLALALSPSTASRIRITAASRLLIPLACPARSFVPTATDENLSSACEK